MKGEIQVAVTIADKCIGCGACVPACPFGALDLGQEGKIIVSSDKCKECGKCFAPCPVEAISYPLDSRKFLMETKKTQMDEKAAPQCLDNPPKTEAQENTVLARTLEEATPELSEYNGGVWVFAEHLEGNIAGVTLELISEGRKLAQKLNTKLSTVLLGDNVHQLIQPLFEYGSDKVYLMNAPVYHFYRAETYMAGMSYLVQKYKPEILLIGATTQGRDLAGAVATQLGTGLTADCTELDIDLEKRLLLASRPAFGGNIMATILCEHDRPQMATVRPRVMHLDNPVPGRSGELIEESIEINEENLLTKVIEIVKGQDNVIRLDEAEIIVCGGRGLQDKKGFDIVYGLAEVLGATVACTRPAVELGWIEHNRQIGQTGVTISPKLYFAIGISGAIQHIVGMQGSETVIAINTDPDCPMMKLATYGVVGDAFEIVPKLTEELKRVLKPVS